MLSMKSFLITVGCLLFLSGSLHIDYHQSPQTYLNSLKMQQQSITNSISSLKSQITQTKNIVQNEGDILKKIKLLEQAILKQKASLKTLQRATIVPLNDSQFTCQNYMGTSKSQLQTLTNNVIKSINNVNNNINLFKNSSSIGYFSQDSGSAITSANDILKSINSEGSQVSTLNSTKQSNWLATNWVTGNKTIQQIQYQTKQLIESSSYIQACPLQTPYFDGIQCINCPKTSQYFNVDTKKCVQCDSFDPATHKCSINSSITPTNPPKIIYNGTNFVSASNRIILDPSTNLADLQKQPLSACPIDKPFFVSGQCINCESPNTLFNYTSKKCTTCQSGTTYVPEKHLCIGPKEIFVTNLPASSDKLILPDGVNINDLQIKQQQSSATQTVVLCPSDTPFYNNVSCIKCQTNQLFNIATLTCQQCPSGSHFNSTIHKCISTVFYSNLTNRNWTSTNSTKVKNDVSTISKTPGAVSCPQTASFYDGTKCISCPLNKYFSFDGLKCQSCSSGTVFNPNQHSCVFSQQGLFQTNVTTAPNLIYGGTSKGEWTTIYRQNQQNNPQIADCPITRPFYDGISCITCPADYPYFNLHLKVCQICDTGSKYDPVIHECLTESGDIVSQSPNIEKMIASIFT